MFALLFVLAAHATSCTSRSPPLVMGGLDSVELPANGVLQVTWSKRPAPWPPVFVLADGDKPHLRDLEGRRTVPMEVREHAREAPPIVDESPFVELRAAGPIPVGSRWRLYVGWEGLGWLSWTEVVVVDTVATPTWSVPPTIRTHTPAWREAASNLLRPELTWLLVPADATGASFIGAWAGSVGEPIDYARPPDEIAPRGERGFLLGNVGFCQPRLLEIPVTGGEGLRYGLRPIDALGRRGPPVEVTLEEARANEAAGATPTPPSPTGTAAP